MRPLRYGLLFILPVVSLFAQDLRRPPGPLDKAQVLKEGWVAARDRLEAPLLTSYLPGGPSRPGSTGVTYFRAWLQLWKWCELLSRPDNLTPGQILAANLQPATLQAWINDQELTDLLFANLSPLDNASGVLKRLEEIWLADPQKFQEYESLAVALAVVYDQPFPSFWPHHQVRPDLVPRRDIPVAEQFASWVKSNESNELFFDLRKLHPEQLKFLVDAPLDPSEFGWARKNVRFPRSDFAKAFSSISYDESRVRSQHYDWDSGEYTLAEITHRGGICVDQAYYAFIAGKARGLPTLFFTGQGQDGGHAWFGYMKANDKWELDCGRYENQNYAIGEALDPQTWQPVSDHELAWLAQSFRDTLQYSSSQDDILMATRFEQKGQIDKALRAADSAIQVCPQNVDAWDAKAALLRQADASQQTLRTHYQAAVEQFTTDRDLRVAQQQELLKVERAQGDALTADALEKDIMLQNKQRRSDLSVNVAATRLTSLVANKQYDDAFKEYRDQISHLAKAGGGNFFNEIVEPFVVSLAENRNFTGAKEAISLARKALQPDSKSILEVEMNELEKAVDQVSEKSGSGSPNPS